VDEDATDEATVEVEVEVEVEELSTKLAVVSVAARNSLKTN
jgi:hypothetical protein